MSITEPYDDRDVELCGGIHCQECKTARLVDRLTKKVKELSEELEVERGRNRVLGFQIRTLREGK